jgi:uridine kinase
MTKYEDNLLSLSKVNFVINKALEAKNIFCIGVDGPTASGKTVFANLLFEKLTSLGANKLIQVIPLDYLLIDRVFRSDSLKKIMKANLNFDHEAELHMDFKKISNLVRNIKNIKNGYFSKRKLFIKNLYSREDNGKCSASLDINLNQNTIIIFEGHYTTRPELSQVLDENFILLANRKNLIERKIKRTAGYRDSRIVQNYFDFIDEPSYLSNYSRFADDKSIIIDNSNFVKPKLTNFLSIYKLLNYSIFLNNQVNELKNASNFIFGNHGVLKRLKNKENVFNSCVSELFQIKGNVTRRKIYDILDKNNLECNIVYFKVKDISSLEIGFYTNLFGKEVQWVFYQKNQIIKQLIFWEGGTYILSHNKVSKVNIREEKETILSVSENNFLKFLIPENNTFISIFEKSFLKKNNITLSVLDNSNEIVFIAKALKFTSLIFLTLGDFIFITKRNCLIKQINKFSSDDIIIEGKGLKFTEKKALNVFEFENEDLFLTDDIIVLKSFINKKTLNQLSKFYFQSKNHRLRNTILNGILLKHNKNYIPKRFSYFLKLALGFFPSSMSRIYALNKLKLLNCNVLAANIYDIKSKSIDGRTYLEASMQKSIPIILQSSLNAIGQKELDGEIVSHGYLKPKKGIEDLASVISDELIELLETSVNKKIKAPFYGIGLDHVDVKGDIPNGRSKRFVENAIQTEIITHFTLDGSKSFKPKNKTFKEISKAYVDVFKTSISFLGKQNLENIDLEFCTGELNYIGEKNKPHYPDGKEIKMLPMFFSQSLKFINNKLYSLELNNLLKLYVANLGTTHHANDVSNNLKLELASDWQSNLCKSNFISPVLHGTTGSTDKTFKIASKSCFKINIAGTFLKYMLDSFSEKQKKIIGYPNFDAKSKYLCSYLNKINKNDCYALKVNLKKTFFKYCVISNVKTIDEENMKILRKPLIGRNKIAKRIFETLETLL